MNDPYAPLGDYKPELFTDTQEATDDDYRPFSEPELMGEIDLFYLIGKRFIDWKYKPPITSLRRIVYPIFEANGDIITGEIRIDFKHAGGHSKYTRPIAYSKANGLVLGAPGGLLRLFNGHKILSNPSANVIVVEGPKKAMVLESYLNDPRFVVCSVIMGSSTTKRFDWSPLNGRDVIILPDHDSSGMIFALSVSELCKARSVRVVDYDLVPWIDVMQNKDDIEDIIDRGATRDQVIDLISNRKYELSHGFDLNKEYKLSITGISKVDEKGNETPISSGMQLLGLAKDEHGSSWSKHIRVRDPDAGLHDLLIPDGEIHTDTNAVIEKLSSNGMKIYDQKELMGILKRVQSRNRSIIVHRPGWNGDDFIVPGHRFSAIKHNRCVFDGFKIEVMCKGSLQDWKDKVARFAIGNPSLMLALGITFGAPLLKLLAHDSFVVHLVGGSSSGKTISGEFLSSGTGMAIQSWRTTDNALEGMCKAHNDLALCLDEIKQSDPFQCAASAYMIANGKGKSRMTSDAINKPVAEWRVIGFSTGEIGLRDHANVKTYAGQDVRFIELTICGKYGVFNELHGYQDGKSFADGIKDATKQHRGSAMYPYIQWLSGKNVSDLKSIYESFLSQVHGNGQSMRVAGHFAILATGIEAAIEAKILPFDQGSGIDAMISLLNSWKSGHKDSGEYRRALLAIRNMIQMNPGSFIDSSNPGSHLPNPLYGVRSDSLFSITAAAWDKELPPEVKSKVVKEKMHAEGILQDIKSVQAKLPITGTNTRFYQISTDALGVALQG
jgi:putative DNA primase/helicase